MEIKTKIISPNSERILGRDAVKQMFITKVVNNELILDMRNIEFLSRAAAHELIFQKEKLDNTGQNLILKNIKLEVSRMIDSVRHSFKKDKSQSNFREVTIYDFDSEKELEEFIETF